MIALAPSCRLSGPMSSLERVRPLAHEGRFARPVRRKREWDENENKAESWQVERTALRRPPQAFEKRSRRARRKTPFSPSGMASIARRSPNGRRVSFRPTCGWVRKIPVLTLGDEVIILAYRWRTRLSLDHSLVRLKRLMPQLSRSALYRCLERHGLSKIGRTNVSPPLTSASLAGLYRFEITANDVALPGDVLRVPVFLAVEEVTKHAYGEVAEATPENAAAFLARLVAEFPQKIDAVTTDI